MLDRWISIGSLWGSVAVYRVAMFKLCMSATRMRHFSVQRGNILTEAAMLHVQIHPTQSRICLIWVSQNIVTPLFLVCASSDQQDAANYCDGMN